MRRRRHRGKPRLLWDGRYKPYYMMTDLDEYKVLCPSCNVAMIHRDFNFEQGLPVYACPMCGRRVLYDES